MSTAPAFASTPKLGHAAVSTANTNRDGTGTIVAAYTAGASGGKVNRVVLKATGDPDDSIVTMFVDTTGAGGWELYDEFDISNPAAGSTTLEAYRVSRAYDDFVLEAGQKIGFAITVSLTSGEMNAFVHAGNF